jgi:hypothetical protein
MCCALLCGLLCFALFLSVYCLIQLYHAPQYLGSRLKPCGQSYSVSSVNACIILLFVGFYVLRVLCISLWIFMFRVVSICRNGGCTEVRHSQLQGPFASKHSFGRTARVSDGAVNKLFLMYLFLGFHIAIQFLKETGLIRSQMTCSTCGRDMTWCVLTQRKDCFRWMCRKACCYRVLYVSTYQVRIMVSP